MKALALAIAVCAAIAVSVFGCGGDSPSEGSARANPSPSLAEVRERARARTRARGGTPPKKLVVRDLIVGDGPAADRSKVVTVRYAGFDYRTGVPTDRSWSHVPADFDLTKGIVLEGLKTGIVGMKVGGRRELIIPPRLAFGSTGVPGKLGPNATVVYVVDLLKIEPRFRG
jgi:peptidylprolyl isomerase